MRIRSLAWLAIAAQAVFIASWVIAGALEPGYSPARSTISALEADGASHPWIVMTGLFALALGAAALVPGLRATLPDRPATRVAAALFGVVALGFLVVLLVRPDCD